MENLETGDMSEDARKNISFVNFSAEEFEIPPEADAFYFFHPFSIRTLKKVVENIVASFCGFPRPIKLFFYYPSDEYVAFLSMVPQLIFVDEIDCNDMFDEDTDRNRILIWEM